MLSTGIKLKIEVKKSRVCSPLCKELLEALETIRKGLLAEYYWLGNYRGERGHRPTGRVVLFPVSAKSSSSSSPSFYCWQMFCCRVLLAAAGAALKSLSTHRHHHHHRDPQFCSPTPHTTIIKASTPQLFFFCTAVECGENIMNPVGVVAVIIIITTKSSRDFSSNMEHRLLTRK